ncbi:Hydroxyacylglutathione hydrolase [Magnetococcus marinus MC-1]|uniref:Hydroxyacylglutathione hydrolase n=1 Tax=Magnetococcus marinus (strain ATCC BAA-1437 / JCM 17883 / MC-1) TaxID=156889 RepID=A0L873_MAGMM|nr:hydroxyacylglutathione hydrolase [Magnetococcus marinus]ABK44166.1 Hydroxyacylglutathione hydrolase [Magnetococcus marinus MC-1]
MTIPLEVTPLPAWEDNYIWCFPTEPGAVAVVDPGQAEPVTDYLQQHGLRLSHILLTHHHGDHIDGVAPLQRKHHARVLGSALDAHRLPPLDEALRGGQTFCLGPHQVDTYHTPGHTSGHLCYHIADCLFAGDTLFSYGCGRLFEGTPQQMWQSLLILRALPETTRLCCAHEYTLTNLRFARSLPGQQEPLAAPWQRAQQTRQLGKPTLPSRLAEEKQYNPFLRCDDTQFRTAVGQQAASAEACFAYIRQLRNHF